MTTEMIKVRITNRRYWYHEEVYTQHLLDVLQHPINPLNYVLCDTESNYRAFEAFHKNNPYGKTFTFSSLRSTPRTYNYNDVWIDRNDFEIIHNVKSNQQALQFLRKD